MHRYFRGLRARISQPACLMNSDQHNRLRFAEKNVMFVNKKPCCTIETNPSSISSML